MDPLEVNDFSGGITDFPLQGKPNRAEKLDNFLITQDNKLVMRDAYKKPNLFTSNPFGDQVIDELFTIENRAKLLAFSEGAAKLKDKSLLTNWVNVTGSVPNGGQISIADYTDTTYFTSDTDTTPRKIYQDENGDYVSRRVGLPQTLSPNTMTDATLLASCIALANEIRSKFIDHLEDYLYVTYTSQFSTFYGKGNANIHANRDKKTLSYFQTEVFVIGDPEAAQTDVPVAPAATNATTLFALVKALKLAMNHHVGDASIGTTQQLATATVDPTAAGLGVNRYPCYHNATRNFGTSNYIGDDFYAGPSIFMDSGYDITSVVDAARELDEIYRVYVLHKNGLHIHSFENDPAYFALYDLALPQIGTVYSETDFAGVKTVATEVPPTVTADLTHFYNFINNIKFIYQKHAGTDAAILDGTDWPVHTQRMNNYGDTFWSTAFNVDLADCDSLLEAEVLLYHLRAQFWNHNQDARPFEKSGAGVLSGSTEVKYKYWTGEADFVNGSPNLTNLEDLTAVAKRLFSNVWIYAGIQTNTQVAGTDPYGTSDAPLGGTAVYIARVNSSGVGTAVLDRNIGGATTANIKIMASWSKYHGYAVENAVVTGTTADDVSSASSLLVAADDTSSTVTGMMALARELFFALEAHTRDSNIHISGLNGTDLLNINSNGNLASSNSVYLTNVPNLPFFVPEAGTVNYAFFYSDSYIVDEFQQTEKLVLGSPVYVGPIDVIKRYGLQEKIETENSVIYQSCYNKLQTPEDITNLPTLTGYDTDIKMNIYRNSLNGSIYFLVDEIANGTSTYEDYSLDELSSQGKEPLITRQQIYTTGGVVGFDQIEAAKYVHIVNNKAYYAGIYEDGKLIKNRLLQSISGAPDAVPATFFDDFEDEIVGLSSVKSNLIVLCKNSIYREAGEFGETGQGFLSHEKISDVVGCLNQKSIVQTEVGLFFAGTDGFYYTDGYQLIKLSLEIDNTYKRLTRTDIQKSSITGSYDPQGRRIWFSIKVNNGDVSNSVFYVLHLNQGVKPSAAFTKCFGTNISNTAHVFWNDGHYLGVESGYIVYSSPDQKSDINVLTNYTEQVNFDYLSCALDAGSIFQRKYATKLHVMGDNVGNANIEPYIIRDKNSDNIGIRPIAEITYKDNCVWGQPSVIWGQADTYWNNTGKMDEWRRFPRTTIRSDVFQVGFRNSDIGVYNSDGAYFPEYTFANVVIDVSTNTSTATIYQDGALEYEDIKWPLDIVGMSISFDIDDYETEYEILSQSGADLVFDGLLAADVTELKFNIVGKKRNQRVAINSYVVHFANIGDDVKSYNRGDNGKN